MDTRKAAPHTSYLLTQFQRAGLKKTEKHKAFLVGNQQISSLHSQVSASRRAAGSDWCWEVLHFGLALWTLPEHRPRAAASAEPREAARRGTGLQKLLQHTPACAGGEGRTQVCSPSLSALTPAFFRDVCGAAPQLHQENQQQRSRIHNPCSSSSDVERCHKNVRRAGVRALPRHSSPLCIFPLSRRRCCDSSVWSPEQGSQRCNLRE